MSDAFFFSRGKAERINKSVDRSEAYPLGFQRPEMQQWQHTGVNLVIVKVTSDVPQFPATDAFPPFYTCRWHYYDGSFKEGDQDDGLAVGLGTDQQINDGHYSLILGGMYWAVPQGILPNPSLPVFLCIAPFAQFPILARLNAFAGGFYGWQQVHYQGLGIYTTAPGDLSGTPTVNPLVELNGTTGLHSPIQRIVWAWPGRMFDNSTKQHWLAFWGKGGITALKKDFKYKCSGVNFVESEVTIQIDLGHVQSWPDHAF